MRIENVDWEASFSLLRAQNRTGRLMIEMWNDNAVDSIEQRVAAREFIEVEARGAGIPVAAP